MKNIRMAKIDRIMMHNYVSVNHISKLDCPPQIGYYFGNMNGDYEEFKFTLN